MVVNNEKKTNVEYSRGRRITDSRNPAKPNGGSKSGTVSNISKIGLWRVERGPSTSVLDGLI